MDKTNKKILKQFNQFFLLQMLYLIYILSTSALCFKSYLRIRGKNYVNVPDYLFQFATLS